MQSCSRISFICCSMAHSYCSTLVEENYYYGTIMVIMQAVTHGHMVDARVFCEERTSF
jgi:hypothetical protein